MLNRWQKMAVGVAEIIDGILAIITIGSYRINLAFRWSAYFCTANIRNEK